MGPRLVWIHMHTLVDDTTESPDSGFTVLAVPLADSTDPQVEVARQKQCADKGGEGEDYKLVNMDVFRGRKCIEHVLCPKDAQLQLM